MNTNVLALITCKLDRLLAIKYGMDYWQVTLFDMMLYIFLWE